MQDRYGGEASPHEPTEFAKTPKKAAASGWMGSAAIGISAPLLLVILRLIQGFAVGGAISGASAMIIEHAPFGRRGYYGSFTLQGVQAGQILAAAVILPLSALLSKDAFQSWAGGSRSC